jgi:hypothetical protein
MGINWQGLLLLLLFIAPGFLYSRAYLAARPRYRRVLHLFEQMVVALVGSTLIHASLIGALAVVVLIRSQFTGNDPLIKELFPTQLANAPVSVGARYSLIAAAYIAASLMLAQRVGTWLGEHAPRWYRFLAGDDPPKQVLLWYSTLVEEPLRNEIGRPRLVVRLRNGESFEGDLVELRLSADEPNFIELALEKVTFKASRTDSSRSTSAKVSRQKHLLHHRVLLRSADILWVARLDKPEKKIIHS